MNTTQAMKTLNEWLMYYQPKDIKHAMKHGDRRYMARKLKKVTKALQHLQNCNIIAV